MIGPTIFYSNYMAMESSLHEAKAITPRGEHCDIRAYVLKDAFDQLSGEFEQLKEEIKQLKQKLNLKEFEIDQARNHKLFSIRQQLKDYEEALKFECGDRCAYQNPCNAREVLIKYEA